MIPGNDSHQELQRDGRVWLRGAVPDEDLRRLSEYCKPSVPGARLNMADLESALRGAGWVEAVEAFRSGAKPVRALSFDKTPNLNWSVPWHQDRVIALTGRHDAPGFSNWSQKAGVWHCEPPLNLLKRMLFVRIHLDDCGADNGAMEIALGSHRHGMVSAGEAEAVADACAQEVCTAVAGDILILDMLLLHRSRPTLNDAPRRVLRIDFSPDSLPEPLAWSH